MHAPYPPFKSKPHTGTPNINLTGPLEPLFNWWIKDGWLTWLARVASAQALSLKSQVGAMLRL